MISDPGDPTAAFERLAERSLIELRDAAELNEALRAERDDLAAQLAAIRSHPLVRIARKVSRVIGSVRGRNRGRGG